MSSASQREILNIRTRTQASYRIFEFIQKYSPTRKNLIDTFSLGETELAENSLLFLRLLGFVKEEDKIIARVKVSDEYDFKLRILQAIYKHRDVMVSYVGDVVRQIYRQGQDLNENELLVILRDVRRKAELSDETMKDTGKLENLKPILTYLGVIGKGVIGNRVTYYQCLDPLLLHKLMGFYLEEHDSIQLAEFLEWLDKDCLPTLESGRPYEAIARSLEAAERMALMKLDDPSDFRKKVKIGGRDVSRVVLAI